MKKIDPENLGRFVSLFIITLGVVMFINNVIEQFSENASILRWSGTIVVALIITKLNHKFK